MVKVETIMKESVRENKEIDTLDMITIRCLRHHKYRADFKHLFPTIC